jgi:hypothetical protein
MFNIKRIFAIAVIATFLAAIPLAAIPVDNGLMEITYTISYDAQYAKPSGGGGGNLQLTTR